MRKVFLDELPRKTHKGRACIDWVNSIGFIIPFQYYNITGSVKILNYNKNNRSIEIEYLDKNFKLNVENFRTGKLRRVVGVFTIEFKYSIGSAIIDNKRNLLLTDKKYLISNNGQKIKWYRYTCNKCTWTKGWITEGSIKSGSGCSCCAGKTVVEGINDIPTIAPWMTQYFQGGYDEAKLYTVGSGKRIYPICPNCGEIKNQTASINKIYVNKSINCTCSDGVSYPEKFIFNVFQQLKNDFIFQFTSHNQQWCNKYRYDFYIKNYKAIIETHGLQHYEQSARSQARSLLAEQENDRLKEQLAKENNIKHYIVLDCRKSELEWIKKSVMESELPTLLNFKEEDIDWLECEEFALSNLIKQVCEYKNNNRNLSTIDIGKIFKLCQSTIIKYLKKGTIIGWCYYNPKDEKIKSNKKKSKTIKPVEIFKDNISLGKYNSTTDLINEYKIKYNIILHAPNISNVCHNKRRHYKGYYFRFI